MDITLNSKGGSSNHLYNAMCKLLECLRKEHFNKKYEDFKLEYADEKSVLTYVATG